MKISEEFPSKWLKASDLKGQEVKVIMSNVESEDVGDGLKPVLYFKGKDKGVVLNKTNAGILSDFYGDDTADWYDQPVILYAIKTEYQGKPVDGLRVRIPTAKDTRTVAPIKSDPISSGPAPKAAEIMNDDIPF